MKILLMGSNGQLGTECQRVLPDAGHEVVSRDLPELDILDEQAVRACVVDFRPEVIVNAAAYTAVDRAEGEGRGLCWQVNQQGPAILARLATEMDIYLIHVSTDYVFSGGRPPPEAYVETDATEPQSEYGKSKLAGEEEIRRWNPEYAILRTAWLYGAKGHNFLKTILRRVRAFPEKELRVVNDQFGSPTCALSLARQIQTVMEARATGLFHASDEGACTWYDFAKAFFEEMGMSPQLSPCSTADYPTPAKRPPNAVLVNAVLKALGLNRMPDWRDDLAAYVRQNRDALLDETRPE